MTRNIYTGKTSETLYKGITLNDKGYDDGSAITDPDCSHILLTAREKTSRNHADLIDLNNGSVVQSFKLKNFTSGTSMALHPKIESAAFIEGKSHEEDYSFVRVYDTSTGTLKWEHAPGEYCSSWSIKYTPDGKYLTANENYEDQNEKKTDGFIVFDSENGREIRRFPCEDNGDFLFSPDGQIIALECDDHIVTYSFATGKKLQSFPCHLDRVVHFCFSPDGHQLASIGGDQIFICNAITGEKVTVIGGGSGSGVSSVITVSDDSKTVVSAGEHCISVFDGEEGFCRKRWRAYDGEIVSISIRRDGTVLKVVSWNRDDRDKGHITKWWDIASGKEISPLDIPEAELKTSWSNKNTGDGFAPQVVVSPDGNYKAEFEYEQDTRYNHSKKRLEMLKITNIQNNKVLGIPVRGVIESPYYNHQIQFSEDSQYLVTWEKYDSEQSSISHLGRIMFINVQTGNVDKEVYTDRRWLENGYFTLTKQGDLISVLDKNVYHWNMKLGCPDRNYEKTRHSWGTGFVFSKKNGQLLPKIWSEYPFQCDVTPDEKYFINLRPIPGHYFAFVFLDLWSIKEGKPIKSFRLNIPKNTRVNALWDIECIRVNEDASIAVIVTQNGERDNQDNYHYYSSLLVVNLVNEELVQTIDLPVSTYRIGRVQWKSGSEVEVLLNESAHSYEERLTMKTTPCIYHLANIGTGQVSSQESTFPINTRKIHSQFMDRDEDSVYDELSSVSGNGLYGDKTIIDTVKNEKILRRMFFNHGKDWLVITPEGLFDGTPEARRMVTFRVGNSLNVQPVESFFQDFYYPGLMSAIWKGERPKPKIQVKNQLPPEIQFLSPKLHETTDGKTEFEVALTDKGGGIKMPTLTLNGIGVFVGEKPVKDGKNLRWSFTLPLVEGVNSIVVTSATSDGQIAGESQPFVLKYESQESVEDRTTKLFVLAVGVSDYKNGTQFDLQCAKNDATTLANVFKERCKHFYGENGVVVKTLTDAEVTKANISAAFDELAKKARPQDTFIFSVAGHGQTVGQLYYFCPYDFPFASDNGDSSDEIVRKNGIGGDVLNDWINAVPAMKRVVIYDTCQSEAALSRNAMEERKAMESLSKMTGCFTIAAAAGKEAALELPDIGHGVLTYALLAGLGAADKGLLKTRNAADSDGLVRVRDWLGFAQDQVSNLSEMSFGKEQRAIFLSGSSNFPVMKIKK